MKLTKSLYNQFATISYLLIFAAVTPNNASGQNRKSHPSTDTVVVYLKDTVYVRDTVWIKDGVLYGYNPDPSVVKTTSKDRLSENKKNKIKNAVDVVTIATYRSLVDSLYTFGIDFDRDSMAKVIIQNDEVFNTDWSTSSVHYSKADPRKMPSHLRFELLKGYEKYRFNWYGKLTWGFGPRWGRMHKGLDTHLEEGDSLFATFNGIVRYAEFNEGGYGNCVVIRHFNGLETIYAHMSKLDVKPGDLVFTGEPLGLGGTTGRSDGPHLHFETRYKSFAFDPFLMLDKENELALLGNDFVLDKNTLLTESSGNDDDHGNQPVKSSSSKSKSHTVKKGENLSAIAKKHKTTVEKLMKLNKLKNKNAIRVGQNLKVR